MRGPDARSRQPASLDALAGLPDGTLADAGIGTWRWQVPDDVVHCDESWWQSLGYQPPGLPDPGLQWLGLVHRRDRWKLLRLRARARRDTLEGVLVDCRVRARDGSWVWARLRGRACAHVGGDHAAAYAGIISNISRERELELRYEAVIDRPFQFSSLLAPDGAVVEISRSSLQASGYRTEQVIGHKCWETPYFRDLPLARDLVRCGVESAAQGEMVRIELPTHAADGSVSTVDFSFTPLYDDDGGVVSLILEGRDITQVATVRNELRQAEDRLSHATAAGNIGLWDWNPVKDEVWFNDQFHWMLGYEPGELTAVGQTFVDMAHPEDREGCLTAITELVEGRVSECRHEVRRRCKDGSWRWVLVLGRILRRAPDGIVTRIAGVQLDITARRELEVQLAAAHRLESLGRLSAGLAHEINTPIQFVQDSVYFIDEAVRELLASVPQGGAGDSSLAYCRDNLSAAVARAREGLERVAAIVRSMRDFSHPDAAQMTANDINRAVETTLVVTRHEYRSFADVTTELGDVPRVKCHGSQINQVLTNLVVNAAHAIADVVGDSGERGCITIRTWQNGSDVWVSVEDTGHGIPEAVRHRIFEPFFTTKPVGCGTGQGLTTARAIVVRQHGGDLSFTTALGCGTTFLLRLPVDGPDADRVAQVV